MGFRSTRAGEASGRGSGPGGSEEDTTNSRGGLPCRPCETSDSTSWANQPLILVILIEFFCILKFN